MWRFLAVPLFLSLIPICKADGSVIEDFSHDPIPLLGAGEDSIAVRFSWTTSSRNCQLVLDEQFIDVSSVRSATVNIPDTMDVRLRCGADEALTHIPVRKKLSIMSLTLGLASEGHSIRWEAFGAVGCQIRDRANQLEVRDLPASGEYLVKEAASPLSIQLICEDALGLAASVRSSEFRRVNREQNLWAKAVEPKKK